MDKIKIPSDRETDEFIHDAPKDEDEIRRLWKKYASPRQSNLLDSENPATNRLGLDLLDITKDNEEKLVEDSKRRAEAMFKLYKGESDNA